MNTTSDIDIEIDSVGNLKKIKLKVGKNDVSTVIGRNGKTVNAMRCLANSHARTLNYSVKIDVIENNMINV